MSSDTLEHYLDNYSQLQKTWQENWFYTQRESAMNLLTETGFPTTRQEDWRYTNIRPITQKPFIVTHDTVSLDSNEIAAVSFGELLDCIELTFINGVFSSQHSMIEHLPDKVLICDLHDAMTNENELLSKHLTQYANNSASPFVALNTAFLLHGTVIYLPRNTIMERPIHLLYLTRDQGTPFATHPRNLIIMEENTEATLIESYIGLDEADYFTNTVTEISLADNARLNHYKLQQESANSYHIGNVHIRQQKDSFLESHSIALGGVLVRNDIHSQLNAEGAEIILNGLYITKDRQHIDNHTCVDHVKPNTRSTENYHGVLGDQSRAVFDGKVIVHKDAQKVVAAQKNANLLLSNDAEIDTKPALEIYADDILCSHSATIGQLDEDMLFYLRSRAIDEATAKSLLIFAFAEEVINKITLTPIRHRLEYLVIGLLPDASSIRRFTHEQA